METMHSDGEGRAPDLQLIEAARAAGPDGRGGEAFAELYRRHRDSALRYARHLGDFDTAEDVVAEAFARILRVIGAGGGPTVAFRPYLLRTVRNVHDDVSTRGVRIVLSGMPGREHLLPVDTGALDRTEGVAVDPDTMVESVLVARAFASLPERWRLVIWHTLVEGDDLATVGRLLGLNANAVAALGFRAREGLRGAYLSAHLAAPAPEPCAHVRGQLPAYVRDRLGRRPRAAVDEHLRACRACSAAVLEIAAVNADLTADLTAVLTPALLGVAPVDQGTGRGAAAAVPRPTGEMPDVDPVDPVAPVRPVGRARRESHRPRPRASTARPSLLPTPAAAPQDVRPTPGPTPRHAPAPHHAAAPTQDAEPDPDPDVSPPHPAGVDLSVRSPSASDLGASRILELVATTPLPSATLTLEIAGLVSCAVGPDTAFPRATCTARQGSADTTTVVCALRRADAGVLAIEVVVDGPLSATATVGAPGNDDPDDGNDTVVVGA